MAIGLLDAAGGGNVRRVAVAGCVGCPYCGRGRQCMRLGGALLSQLFAQPSAPVSGKLPPEPPGEQVTRVRVAAPTAEAIVFDLWLGSLQASGTRHRGQAAGTGGRVTPASADASPSAASDVGLVPAAAGDDSAAGVYHAGIAVCSADGGARGHSRLQDAVQELRAAGVPADHIVGALVHVAQGQLAPGDELTAESAAAACEVPCIWVDATAGGSAEVRARHIRALGLLLASGRAGAADACALVDGA
eukprot:TRINITY_DN20820_c0_g1_i1.p1 TRINITY_DN20820_c0_g1~~TRINITY_DN20820_c0_g1_i1.p1  ORF type:complete len:261 (+),score=60.66 TRINITY_DN20820_c0_g1_i1:45-785(+)